METTDESEDALEIARPRVTDIFRTGSLLAHAATIVARATGPA